MWRTVLTVVLVILVIIVIVLVVLFFVGQRLQRRQATSQELIDSQKQVVSLMAIDKKKMRIRDSGLPAAVIEQTPWYAKRMKVPIVKAKVGPKIMTLMADDRAYEQLPLRTEAKCVISGLYIVEIKSVRGGIPPLPKKKKTIRSRISNFFYRHSGLDQNTGKKK